MVFIAFDNVCLLKRTHITSKDFCRLDLFLVRTLLKLLGHCSIFHQSSFIMCGLLKNFEKIRKINHNYHKNCGKHSAESYNSS